ncbi:MAG: hypothetical protein K2X54_03175, partial [Methylobacterium organophilum]|nr:hypothetical protein [Methylobacterium organophilum]
GPRSPRAQITAPPDRRRHLKSCIAHYVAAWALLYRRFKRSGIDRDAAQQALEDICAVVHKDFRYLRWDDGRERYLRYPGLHARFDVIERE